MNIIDRLNELRLERNMSVYRLSELSGINQSTLANTFSRGVLPSIANLSAMCEAMGLTLAQFFRENESAELLTKEETALLQNLRRLPPPVQKSIVVLVENIVSSYSL